MAAAQNLQDTFLNHVRKAKTPLTIFLVNGVKLQGVVTWFDNFCVLLRRDGHSQLVSKTPNPPIIPGNPNQLFEGAGEAPRKRRRKRSDLEPRRREAISAFSSTPGQGATGRALVVGPYLRRRSAK